MIKSSPKNEINLGYEARLRRWGINRLEDRRVRGYLIQMYKSVNGLDEFKLDNYPTSLSTERVWARSHKVGIKRETFESKNRNEFCKQLLTRHSIFVLQSYSVIFYGYMHEDSKLFEPGSTWAWARKVFNYNEMSHNELISFALKTNQLNVLKDLKLISWDG